MLEVRWKTPYANGLQKILQDKKEGATYLMGLQMALTFLATVLLVGFFGSMLVDIIDRKSDRMMH